MIRLIINTKRIEVPEGTSILEAAKSMGIEIPVMCHLRGIQEQPSCMVCLVKDLNNNRMYPSCSMPASEGMEIITESEELDEYRKQALELLLSDHLGDCEAPCRLTCPAFMNIPLMNRLISNRQFDEALAVVREEIALPLILGYICPAPCEKACKRKPIDSAVSICLLKRFTADDMERYTNEKIKLSKTGKRVAILGTGPAGLSAAYYLLHAGHDCVLFDKQEETGGALRYSIPDAELPRDVLDTEIEHLKKMGAIFILGKAQSVTQLEVNGYGKFDAFLLATGNPEIHAPDEAMKEAGIALHHFIHSDTYQTSLPGVFACGSLVKELNMAVKAGHQGKLAAFNINRYLSGLSPEIEYYPFNSKTGTLREEEYEEYLKESSLISRVSPTNGFIGGFNAEEAIREAERCMHCDCRKLASCKLRILSDKYKAERKRFAGPHRKQLLKCIQHELVVYEPEKCIKCGICVEIASREKDELGLTYIGRGFDVQVNVPFGRPTSEALAKTAGDCADACPTGALARKESEEHTVLVFRKP